MRARVVPLAFAATMSLVLGCVTVPPEREERDREVLALIEPCKAAQPELIARLNVSVGQDGRLNYMYHDHLVAQTYEFERCVTDTMKEGRFPPFASGRRAAGFARASVSAGAPGKPVVAPARINGIEGRMLVANNSMVTYVREAYARRAKLDIGAQTPHAHVRFADEQRVLPFVRAKSVALGDAAVEHLDVVVYDHAALPAKIDGVLGASFLRHFKITHDRVANRLTLEPP
jgi:hypothetical protein